jgi:hypothetical protein
VRWWWHLHCMRDEGWHYDRATFQEYLAIPVPVSEHNKKHCTFCQTRSGVRIRTVHSVI